MVKLAAIGDCVVDVYPTLQRSFLGGTSFNVSSTAAKLEAKPTLISAIGTDSWGKTYQNACDKLGIINHLNMLPGNTSHVDINLDENNSPQYSAWELGVLKKFSLSKAQETFLKSQEVAICVAIEPLEKILKQYARMNLPHTFKAADFDGTTPYTLNDKAMVKYAPRLNLIVKSTTNKNTITLLKQLVNKYQLMALVTLGDKGSQIFTHEKDYFVPAIKTKATDTTGAGDAYLAAFLVKYMETKNIPLSMETATKVARKKVTRYGASS